MLKEFKPALLFVTKFLAIYFIGNILYGLYVESFDNRPDSATAIVTDQSVWCLKESGENVESSLDSDQPKVHILLNNKIVLSVFEGCNGLNVMIIFLAFLVAYGGSWKKMLWFVPLGLVAIHLANLGRIAMLYYIAHYHPNWMYFTHKFLFTGFIYAFVLLLWYWWVTRLSKQQTPSSTNQQINK